MSAEEQERRQEIVDSERSFNTQIRDQIVERNKGWAKRLWPLPPTKTTTSTAMKWRMN